MEHGNPELTLRALRADDAARLVKMDEVASGRRRDAWYDGRLKRALEDSDIQVSLGAEIDRHGAREGHEPALGAGVGDRARLFEECLGRDRIDDRRLLAQPQQQLIPG